MTLPAQFIAAGIVVMIAAMLTVGYWVAQRIEHVVVANSGIAAALYMDSFISPLSQELAYSDTLSIPAQQALIEVFQNSALSERVVSYKIWKEDGKVVYASDASIIGATFEPTDDLKYAWQDQISSSYEELNDLESANERALGINLLEVYSPIHEVYTGKVIAVAEFYERTDTLDSALSDARQKSWLVVGSVFALSGLILFGIVQAGGRTIRYQRQQLQEQLSQSQDMAKQNLDLRLRVVSASSRAISLTERAVRRIGSDLHDGPAQYLALAALKLDSVLDEKKPEQGQDLRNSLHKALTEIRAISRGLALPDLDLLDLKTLILRAIQDHEQQTGKAVQYAEKPIDPIDLNYAQKLCIYRFLQEALSNAHRHAAATEVVVHCKVTPLMLTFEVRDNGVGFDKSRSIRVRSDGGQGLFGLADRAESIGGTLIVESTPGTGTCLSLILPISDTNP
jgi:signal transduction histidine kinase